MNASPLGIGDRLREGVITTPSALARYQTEIFCANRQISLRFFEICT